jgi:hypothetical protein
MDNAVIESPVLARLGHSAHVWIQLRIQNGGAEGSRTPDLLIANETLYQLSYDPIQLTCNRLRGIFET